MLETENGKMTRQEYKERYFVVCTFSRPEVVIDRHLEYSHSHRIAMGPTKPDVLISQTVWQTSLQFQRQPGVFDQGELANKWYNIERQPEITIWPPKPEIDIPLELQQIASKFQRQVWDFRPWQSRIVCCQVIATMIDNRKWQCGHQKPEILISLELWHREWQFQRQKLTPSDGRQRSTTEDVFGANLAIFGSRSLSQSFG